MKIKTELRYLPARELRITKETDGERTLSGYAIVFNSKSKPIGNFVEIVSPDAVKDTLKGAGDIRLLRDHDPAILLGRTSSGTLKISQDSTGVSFRCILPKTFQASDVAELVGRGDLQGCSFRFACQSDAWSKDGSGQLIRTLTKIDVDELSVVSLPCYPATSVSTRSCPPEFRSLLGSDLDDEDACDCDCPECLAGDCADCSNPDCDDPNCQHGEESARSIDLWRLTTRIAIAQRR
jgi:uncharacterized protein